MASNRKRLIEGRHVVKLQRRLPDVRPWHDKFAEACTQKPLVMVLVFPLIVFSAVFWLVAPITLGVAFWILMLHKVTVPVLPMRYPAINKEPNPVNGKKGDGIMLFGHQESTSPFEKFKEIWSGDDDLRKHIVILGSTGSGKSETLKALFFNALCWSSGFFIADGKADNKLPTDIHTMVRSVGMDDNLLHLNFLLGGKTPEQVRKSRRRRTNKLNFVGSTDADTLIQIGSNMLPKVEGEGKNWQEKALNFWRAVVTALCYKRDTQGFEISVTTLVEYMAMSKVEDLYLEGFREAQELGEWSHGFASIKNYLDSGCPAYKVEKLLAKHGLDGGGMGGAPAPGPRTAPPKAGANDQDSMASEQHAYRTSQLMPVLNLLDKTYGHIFRDKFPEIDMVDVTLNNRIMTLLIPSLEKSAQEAENLGKLAIACLRVMMARNLGGGIEGTRRELLDAKATAAPYPYLVALDELGYYFSDGLAVIFAQARSLGFCMIPAAQDLEKLTEGNRKAEAGAMLANSGVKVFLRIDDAGTTWEFVSKVLGKVAIATYQSFKLGGFGWKREAGVNVQESDLVKMSDLQAMEAGEGVINALGNSTWFRSYYMGKDLVTHQAQEFYVLRFLQCRGPSPQELDATSIAFDAINDPMVKGERLRGLLSGDIDLQQAGPLPPSEVIDAVAHAAQSMGAHVPAHLRGMALFEAARQALRARQQQEAAYAAEEVFAVDDEDVMNGQGQGAQQALPAPQLQAMPGNEQGLWTGDEPWQGRRGGVMHAQPAGAQDSSGDDGFDIAEMAGMPGMADPQGVQGMADAARADDEGEFGDAAQANLNEMLLTAAHVASSAGAQAHQQPQAIQPGQPAQPSDDDNWLAALEQGNLLPGQAGAAPSSPTHQAMGVDGHGGHSGRSDVGHRDSVVDQSPAAQLALDESIDLDDLLDAADPIVRKPVQEIGGGPASLDDALSTAFSSLIDPVDVFLGTAVHFSMPALQASNTSRASNGTSDASNARAAVGSALSGNANATGAADSADIQFGWELDDLLDAAGVTSPAAAAQPAPSGGPARSAVPAAGVVSPGMPATAVGLSAQTLEQVAAIERSLGNPNAVKAAQRVETLVAAHLSQPLSAALPAAASEAEAMLQELRDLEALSREDADGADGTGASGAAGASSNV